jgi:hypothetical protein
MFEANEHIRHKPTGCIGKFDSMCDECDPGCETINVRIYCDSEVAPIVQWSLYDCERYDTKQAEVEHHIASLLSYTEIVEGINPNMVNSRALKEAVKKWRGE